MTFTKEQHKKRHILLHRMLDELLTDFIRDTGKMPSGCKIGELMKWSFEQTKKPSEEKN